jgi:PAP_fibrillin
MTKKEALLESIASQNRGILTKESDRVKILTLIERLEAENLYPNPLEAKEILDGNWRLLYTTNREILGLGRLPLLQLGDVYQCIRMKEAKLYNFAEMFGLPFLEGLVSVAARFEPASEKRVNVKFERSIIGLQRIMGYSNPDRAIEAIEAGKKFPPIDFSLENRDRSGWLEISYLDENLRISRGNQGNIFVLTKENS